MNKRFLLTLLGIVLAGCASTQPTAPSLPPEEVLNRAAQAAQKLESAQYLITADFDMESDTMSAQGVLRMDGILQHAGKQVRFQTDVTADVKDKVQGSYSVDGTVELVVMNDDELYFNIHSLTSQPNNSVFPPQVIGKLAGTWWQLPSEETPPGTTSVTPDPRLLQAQAQVVSVTKDYGVTTFSGMDAYHYGIELDKQKLLAYLREASTQRNQDVSLEELARSLENTTATGELYVDANTFFVQKIIWIIESLELASGGTLDTALTVTFRNQNAAPNIEPPVGSKLFSPAVLFSISPDALFEQELDALNDNGFDDESVEDILRTLNAQ